MESSDFKIEESKILIVDDMVSNAFLLEQLLKSLKIVTTALWK